MNLNYLSESKSTVWTLQDANLINYIIKFLKQNPYIPPPPSKLKNSLQNVIIIIIQQTIIHVHNFKSNVFSTTSVSRKKK